ncbi:MAG: hypothetical protein QOJ65_302 [Fimbriimonadaceae bacterium]|jgi:hypothetical protein|nr:hypothetical protein [Fimbriimonadaceae bacterium]
MQRLLSLAFAALLAATSFAQNDADYGAKIKEYTTEPFFLTQYVDHLPASSTVPSPLKHFGTIIGAPDVLHYTDEINGYMRALDEASDRVWVQSMGKSEEGREMIAVFISDAANLNRLDQIKAINAQISDPRGLVEGGYKSDGKLLGADAAAEKLIAQTLPIYYATGGMHSPESGPPEMLMELAYRLATEETPFIQEIRKNSIVMLTPVLDTDGRDRYVDTYFYRKRNPKKTPIPLVYWGKYVAHDNNRDSIGMSLALSKNLMRSWFDYHPIVMHDLHQSIPFLYISTGTGPYNAWLDPITIDEWHLMAYHEVDEMTKMGVPGVWTHGFYDGWAPNYAFYAANGHNAIGRFYEIFGSDANTRITTVDNEDTQRQWYRPNPPLGKLKWSIRNNVNISQSALLIGMHNVASQKDKFLHNYWLKCKRSVLKPWTEGPAAYVIQSEPGKPFLTDRLVFLLRRQGIETMGTRSEIVLKDLKINAGSVIIPMDQPYSRMADMLLDKQYYKSTDPEPYDDTGWTLGPLFNLDVQRITVADPRLLSASPVQMLGGVVTTSGRSEKYLVFDASPDPWVMEMAYAPKTAEVAEQQFTVNGKTFKPGTLVLRPSLNDRFDLSATIQAENGGVRHEWLADKPNIKTHPLSTPRVMLVHDWQSTQNEGWLRLALDDLRVPYKYTSVHELRDNADLKKTTDVIIFGPSSGQNSIVNGRAMIGDPIPWKPLPGLKHLGGPDTSDDIRGGCGLEGVLHLKKFLADGGLLICMGGSSELPVYYNLVSGISLNRLPAVPNGGVFLTERVDKVSPVLYGYSDQLGAYSADWYWPFKLTVAPPRSNRRPTMNPKDRPSGRGDLSDSDVVQARPTYEEPKEEETQDYIPPEQPRPKVLLKFAAADKALISGGYGPVEAYAGNPALVLCPAGKGSVLLFGINPAWRGETVGSWQLLMNALANWQNLQIDEPKVAEKKADEKK